MDTLQLKLFLSVSHTRSFTKTAGEFYMTQPTVSNYIKALETGIGTKLLNRDSQGVSLTPEGEEFLSYAGQMLKLQYEAENRLRNMAEGRRGFIKIAMLSSAAELFSECLAEFSALYPGVQVDVDILEGAEMTRSVGHSAHDIYFAHRYMVPEGGGVQCIETRTDQLHLFMHRDAAAVIDLDDWSTLGCHHFVSVPETDFSLSGQIKNICLRRGVAPDIINFYNRADTLLLAVHSGIGVAILPPALNFYYNFPNVVSRPIEGDDAVISSVVAWREGGLNPDARSFLQLGALTGLKGERNTKTL